MRINCDWEKCVSDCKHYDVCNLRIPTTERLMEIRKEIVWIHKRLMEINKGIINLYQIDENIHESFREYMPKQIISIEIKKLRTEKEELVKQLRNYQIKEKNMNKLLRRRYNEF